MHNGFCSSISNRTLKIAPRSKIAPRTDGRTDGWMDGRTDGRVTEIPEGGFAPPDPPTTSWGGFAPPDPPTTPFQKICPPGKLFEMIKTQRGLRPAGPPSRKKKDGRKSFRPKSFSVENFSAEKFSAKNFFGRKFFGRKKIGGKAPGQGTGNGDS